MAYIRRRKTILRHFCGCCGGEEKTEKIQVKERVKNITIFTRNRQYGKNLTFFEEPTLDLDYRNVGFIRNEELSRERHLSPKYDFYLFNDPSKNERLFAPTAKELVYVQKCLGSFIPYYRRIDLRFKSRHAVFYFRFIICGMYGLCCIDNPRSIQLCENNRSMDFEKKEVVTIGFINHSLFYPKHHIICKAHVLCGLSLIDFDFETDSISEWNFY